MNASTSIIVIIIASALCNNVVLSQFLGLCPFLGVSKKLNSAFGMGIAVIFVIIIAEVITWPINHFILEKFDATYLQTIVFILVIASLVQIVEMFIKKYSQSLYASLGVYLPLITTNCAVLGVTLNAASYGFNYLQAIVYAAAIAIGFMIAICILAGIREQTEDNTNVPKSFRGMPLTLLISGLMAIAFTGFSGLV